MAQEKALLERTQSKGQTLSLPLDETFAEIPEFSPFLSDTAKTQNYSPVEASVKIERRSYNSITIHATCSQPCLLFLRDAYSPYWSAETAPSPSTCAR